METTPSDDVSLYQLKWIEWKSDFVPIVTQVTYKRSQPV